VETNFLGQKETLNAFVVAHHDSSEGVSIKTLYGPGNAPSTPIQVDGKTYVVDQPSCPLPRLDDAWSKDGLVTLTRNTMPSDATEIFNALRGLFENYIVLEYEEDFDLLVSYVILTYFHRAFPAIPFLLLYGNKESGKTRTAHLFQRLSFSAQMVTRPSEAAMGDLSDGYRGTLIIDQAEFLGLKPHEETVNFLAGTYTQDTGRRTIVQVGGKNGRAIREFDCFSPKIFSATREPHVDLRDRLIVVPMFRPDDTSVLDTLRTPTSTSEDWRKWRGLLYSLYLTQFRAMAECAEQVAIKSGNSQGRSGELLRPIMSIMKFANLKEQRIQKILTRTETRMQEARPSINFADEQVLIVIYNIIKHNKPREIVRVPFSLIREKCAETEEANNFAYENVIYEIINRNQAHLKIKRSFGKTILYTNLSRLRRSMARLDCLPEGEVASIEKQKQMSFSMDLRPDPEISAPKKPYTLQ
jgi:hypothetical protein